MKIVLTILFLILSLTACMGMGVQSDSALTGQVWQLVSYGSTESPIPALVFVDTYMEFNRDGTVSGNLGCNDFQGAYRILGSSLEFGEINYPMLACSESNAITEQEAMVIGALIGRLEYNVNGDTLTIWTEGGGKSALVFKK